MKKLLTSIKDKCSRAVQAHALTLAMLIGAAAAILVAGFASFAGECEQIPEEVLRLHIIADSDSEEDQAFKLELRDFILENFSTKLSDCDSVDSAIEAAEELLPEITEQSRRFAAEKDYTKPIDAQLTEMYFTTRVYKESGVTLPAGNYNALRVTIGEGKGQNWWCVMFPALCLPAVSKHGESASKVSADNQDYVGLPEVVTESPKVKFAIFEFLYSFVGRER